MDNSIFRNSAIEKLESPELLDRSLRIISLKPWFLLGGFFILLAIFLIWGFFGNINSRVHGECIFVSSSGLEGINSQKNAMIVELLKEVGDSVKAGEKVANLHLEALEIELEALKSEHEATIDSLKAMLLSYENEMFHIKEQRDKKIEELEEKIALQQETYALKRDAFLNYDQLNKKGWISKEQFLDKKSELNSIKSELDSLKKEIELTRIQAKKELHSIKVEQERLEQSIMEKETKLDSLQKQIEKEQYIVSKAEGVITEILANEGDFISRGDRLYQIEGSSKDLEVLAYFPSSKAKKIQKNMQANISPTIYDKNRYGTILGEVKSISEYPVSAKEIERRFGTSLVGNLFAKGGAPFEVSISPLKDSGSVSGFKWTFDKGEEQKVTQGTLSECSVVVERRAPVTFLLPKIREFLGV
ncbi:MAG: NHLP bacteriocin system secretion protein [Campylobacterales bacterium]